MCNVTIDDFMSNTLLCHPIVDFNPHKRNLRVIHFPKAAAGSGVK